MKFKVVQENLRKVLWRRIDKEGLTGLRLAEQTGFKQAHISNFLNRKRGLSLEGMDRVLRVQHLSVLDLLDPEEINKRASILPPSADEFENVLLVDGTVAAAEALVMSMNVKEVFKVKKNFLRGLRPDMEGPRGDWERFVAIAADDRDVANMYPRLMAGSTVVLDRHYNSLRPYRRSEPNMYAVSKDGTCIVRYVELVGGQLVLRPHSQAHPVEVIAIEPDKKSGDYLVGRVCFVGVET
jgi:hypothetical protein